MKKIVLENIFLFFLLTILGQFSIKTYANGNKPSIDQKKQVGQTIQNMSVKFLENKGQITDLDGKPCPDVLYSGDSKVSDIYLRKTGISYVFSNANEVMHKIDEQVEELKAAGTLTEMDKQQKKEVLLQREKIKIHRVDMDFEGANTNCRLVNEEQLDGYNNYYYAHCPNGIVNVKQYNKVTYKNIYKGIDVEYMGNTTKGLKYNLIVQPHADPAQIKLHWKGAEELKIVDGKLIIKTSVNEFTESIPKVYQNINGKIVDVKTEYKLDRRCEMLDQPVRQAGRREKKEKSKSHVSCLKSHVYEVSFSFSTFNSSFPLVVDPWATYFGGSYEDYSTDITTDNAANVFVTGYTKSQPTSFPFSPGAFQEVGGGIGNFDAYVVKFDPSGIRQWATYYGGSSTEYGNSVVTDIAGNVFITGYTQSLNFPVLPPVAGYSQAFAGNQDAFVVKFDNFGVRIWAIYYGGGSSDAGLCIATDNSGNVFIAGYTWLAFFPVFPGGGYSQSFGGGISDAFIVKFDGAGVRLWATYYGGAAEEKIQGIATDIAGNIFVTGYTESTDFPITGLAFQLTNGGGRDAFIVKFDNAGIRLWATYYGGALYDYGSAINTDFAGNVVITGTTESVNFPILPAAGYTQPFGGNSDAFILKFDNAGIRKWASYYGGSDYDYGWDIATDVNKNIYLLMEVEDVAAPTLVDECSYQSVFNGGSSTSLFGGDGPEDQLIIKFNPAGQKICATYMGGTGEDDLDFGGGIAIFGSSLNITGITNGGYPVTAGAFQSLNAGGGFFNRPGDVFIASICTNICEGKTALGLNFNAATNVCTNTPIKFTPTISNSCDTTGYKFHWEFTGGNPATSNEVEPTVSFTGTGAHDVMLKVTTLCKEDNITKTSYITTTQCTTCNLEGQFTKGTANCSNCGCKEWVLVNAINGTAPYTYLWPDGYDKRYKNKICAGNYTVKITDKNGCSVDVSITAP